MSKFKSSRTKDAPKVSTASLPDIVFILLAFFIVVSSMKQTELQLDIKKPSGRNVVELDKNEAIDYIYCGTLKGSSGNDILLQLDGSLKKEFIEISTFIKNRKAERTDVENANSTISLQADSKNVKMMEYDKIKAALQQEDVSKINLTTSKVYEE